MTLREHTNRSGHTLCWTDTDIPAPELLNLPFNIQAGTQVGFSFINSTQPFRCRQRYPLNHYIRVILNKSNQQFILPCQRNIRQGTYTKRLLRPEALHSLDQSGYFSVQRAYSIQKYSSCRCDRAAFAITAKQRRTQFTFQRINSFLECWLGNIQFFCRTIHTPAFADRQKGFHLFIVHISP